MERYSVVVESGSCSQDYKTWEERAHCGHAHRTIEAATACMAKLTHSRLTCAVTMCDYAEAQRLAEHALYLESSLTDENRACGLVCLTDEARELAVRLLARAAAKDGERGR